MTEEEFVGGDSTGCQYYSLHVILTMLLVRIPVPHEKGTDHRSRSVPIFGDLCFFLRIGWWTVDGQHSLQQRAPVLR